MSCEFSCENGLDSIAGSGRKVRVGPPLRRGQDRVWKRVVHAVVQSMSQAPDLRCDSTCQSVLYHECLTMVKQAHACQRCLS